ncbi:hypothetical protein [Undibacter mobilis]|uniref:Uncharacterized protein n=1 Tax=Undibacter mobilis TaxID=2292256 RepID=A0A371B0P0_9BRAD|nr:hypothetical protein [Undibacter mobilis]RDV01136.1 hypothetical protein DXH78_18020 [Undibacter mobilis]
MDGGDGTFDRLSRYRPMTQSISEADRTKKRAEASFRTRIREIEGQKAAKEYWTAQKEAIERIPRLRALRLAKEAEQKAEAPVSKPVTKRVRKTVSA